jgi:DNA polymerase delta subunit 2
VFIVMSHIRTDAHHSKNFDVRYATFTLTRLRLLREHAVRACLAALAQDAAATETPAEDVPQLVDRVTGAPEGRACVLVGILFKRQEGKASILARLQREEAGGSAAVAAAANTAASSSSSSSSSASASDSAVRDSDVAELEDEFGRIGLEASLEDVRDMSSGTVVAILGRASAGARFTPIEWFMPGVAPQRHLARMRDDADADAAFPAHVISPLDPRRHNRRSSRSGRTGSTIVCASGIGGMPRDMLSAFTRRLEQLRPREVWLVGDSVGGGGHADADDAADSADSDDTVALNALDAWIAVVAVFTRVRVFTGARDPTTYTLPQPPLPRFLFPNADDDRARFEANPARLTLVDEGGGGGDDDDAIDVLVTGGQPTSDMARHAVCASRVDLLAYCMRARHIAPTAPDTLGCYTSDATDPFVLHATPHLFVVGNQPTFESALLVDASADGARVRTRLLALPVLASPPHVFACVHLDTLQVTRASVLSS